jgi:hypothetical protein
MEMLSRTFRKMTSLFFYRITISQTTFPDLIRSTFKILEICILSLSYLRVAVGGRRRMTTTGGIRMNLTLFENLL